MIGVLAQQDDDSNTTSVDDTATCPVVMLKIRLSDGSVVASTTVSDRFLAKGVSDMNLSFSTDRAALLLAGGNGDPQLSATQKGRSDYVALRLSAEDLSIQFDAHSILNSKRATVVTSYGQAVGSKYATSPSEMIIFLADANTNSPERRTTRSWCVTVGTTTITMFSDLTRKLEPETWPPARPSSCRAYGAKKSDTESPGPR